MSGPIVLLTLFVLIFLLVKYQGWVKGYLPSASTVMSLVPKSKFGWKVFGVIVLAALVIWGLHGTHGTFPQTLESPSLATVWAWTRSHWFWISLVLVIAYIAFLFFPKDKGTAKTVRGVLIVIAVMLFVVLPIAAWIATPSTKVAQGGAARNPSTLTLPPRGFSNHIEAPVGWAVHFDGHGYVIHCVYRNGTEGIVGDNFHPCGDGDMLYVYLENTLEKENDSVTYSFVRKN